MDMRLENPLPNFARVGGHRATFEYRGVRRLCRRCKLEGHFKAHCDTPHCVRYGVFGHRTDTCTEPCRRCGGAHASVDCTAMKTYSMAAAMDVGEFPTLGAAPASGQTQRRLTTLRPAKRLEPSEDGPEPNVIPEKTLAQATAITAPAEQQEGRQADAQTPARMRTQRSEESQGEEGSHAEPSQVAATAEAERAADSGGPGDGKEDRSTACKGSQGERKLGLKGKTGPAGSTAAQSAWWNKKGGDHDAPHGRDVLQSANDKHPNSPVEQEKSVNAPGGEDAPKHPELSIPSWQQPLPESAPQYGGASQQSGQEGAQHGVQHGEARRQDGGICG
ncbi:hypothetical protein HPB52_021754 [Rhipicephalus sanguineus]|uniref:Nucleic-acid-binding protein from mobile element jockey n=1 Tax=Rhipicephalus sanguineus TaxID=34632 RepID=A0A9D4QFF2_RHISA|nr:hypothetical protein HPB52_021754 [Rhipicephalus sanguineus]